ncbi:hypothetical protein ABK040_007294 [Willaertia magna]
MSFNDKKRLATLNDLKEFVISFEAILDHPPTYEILQHFLEQSNNGELLLFLKNVTEYRSIKSEKHRIQKAKEMKTIFFNQQNSKLNLFTEIKVLTNLENNNGASKTIFDNLETEILLSIKENYFKSFLESDIFKQFIVKNSIEVLHEIGSLKFDASLRLVESFGDLTNDTMTLKDAKFIKMKLDSEVDCNEQNSEWKLISKRKSKNSNHILYFSLQTFDFGSSTGVTFFRIEVDFPYPALLVLNTLIEKEYRIENDGNLTNLEAIKYNPSNYNNSIENNTIIDTSHLIDNNLSNHHNVNEKNNNTNDKNKTTDNHNKIDVNNYPNDTEIQLATCNILETYWLNWPLADREFLGCYACVFDETKQSYYILRKTCHCKEIPNPRKGKIRGAGVGGWKVTILDENSCKYTQVFYVDFKGNIPRAIISAMIKRRAKITYKLTLKYLEKNLKRGNLCLEDLNIYKTLKENTDKFIF